MAERIDASEPTTPDTAGTAPETPELPLEADHEAANRLLRQHVWGAMGVGLIPFPITDIVGLMAIHLNLLRKLAQRYHVPFKKDVAKNIITSLVTSTLPVALTPAVVLSVAKIIPGLGQTAGVLTLPLLGGASTYALGKVFIQHFASGGTFLTFDPEQVKAYYQQMFEEGKQVVSEMSSKSAAS